MSACCFQPAVQHSRLICRYPAEDDPFAFRLEFVLKTQKCKDPDCGQVHPMLVRVPMSRDEQAMYRDQHPCCWLPPLDDERLFAKALKMDAEQLVSPCQRHKHTFTCYKYYDQLRKRDPTIRRACRFKFGRKLVVTSSITAEGAILLRRLSHYVNNYNTYMLTTMRCNHDISHLLGTDSNAMAAVYYIFGYVNKMPPSLVARLPVIQVALARMDEIQRAGGYDKKTLGQKAGSFLAMVQNQLQRTVETGLPMIMASLAGLPETVTSHQFAPLLAWSFVADLEQSDRQRGYAVQDEPFMHTERADRVVLRKGAEGGIKVRCSAYDYQRRDMATMRSFSLYDMACFCEKVAIATLKPAGRGPHSDSDSSNSDLEVLEAEPMDLEPGDRRQDTLRFAFGPEHPEYSTHVLWVHRLKDAKVPRYNGPKFPNRMAVVRIRG